MSMGKITTEILMSLDVCYSIHETFDGSSLLIITSYILINS